MKILVDTNVILDIILNRREFVDASKEALEKAINKGDRLFFSCSAITDVYYIVRKQTGDKRIALKAINNMQELFNLLPVDEIVINNALSSKVNDFEDAVLDELASLNEIGFIITRNIIDFSNSRNKCITPTDYIKLGKGC